MVPRDQLHTLGWKTGIGTTAGETEGEEVDEGQLTVVQGQVVARLEKVLTQYFPTFGVQGAKEVVMKAFRQADETFGTEVANAWAADFQRPQDLIARDVARFREAGQSIAEMARRIRADRRPHRLEFADHGVELVVDDNFVPSGVEGRPKLRKKLSETGNAVERMMFESYVAEDLAIVLPLDEVRGAVETVNLSAASWARASGKPSGRAVVDTNDGGSGTGLNSEAVKEACIKKWDKIDNPTLDRIGKMIWRFFEEARERDPAVKWEDLRLWKMDLKGAFTLLDFNPDDVRLLGVELEYGIVVFYLCGLFGWTGMPMAFQAINRALVWELRKPGVLKGLMDMYTDDAFGVTLAKDLQRDMDTVASLCRRLLGETAVADHKTASGRRLTLLGWDIDLAQVLVTIAEKNALKAFHGYAQAEVAGYVPRPVVEAYASWAERYGEVCLWMRPFRRVLYNEIRGRERQRSVVLTPMGRRVVRLYQALLALALIVEGVFTRRLSSFRACTPTLLITLDGSLQGAGIVWHVITGYSYWYGRRMQHITLLGGAAFDLRSLWFGWDPAYQNTAEYISILLGLVVAVLMGWDTKAIKLVGDSVTALTWASEGRFRSDNVINAATVFAVLNVDKEINVVETEQILSEDNTVADTLSRREEKESWRDLMRRVKQNAPDEYQPMTEFRLSDLEGFLKLCDPRAVFDSEKEFVAHWRAVCSFMKNLRVLSD